MTWLDDQRINDDDALNDEEFECDRCREVYHRDLLGYSEGPGRDSDDGLGTMWCINCYRPIEAAWIREDAARDLLWDAFAG